MEGRKKTLGLEHANTLTSIDSTGDVLYNQKKYTKAKFIYRRAIKGKEKTLGLEYTNTLTSINNVGVALNR